MSHFTNKSNKPKIAPTPSFSVVDLNSSPHSYTIDQETLIDIVKEKNIETLQSHGGVEAVASNLKINIEFGIKSDDFEDISIRQQSVWFQHLQKNTF
jgi:Ca2+-transporting ATPase